MAHDVGKSRRPVRVRHNLCPANQAAATTANTDHHHAQNRRIVAPSGGPAHPQNRAKCENGLPNSIDIRRYHRSEQIATGRVRGLVFNPRGGMSSSRSGKRNLDGGHRNPEAF